MRGDGWRSGSGLEGVLRFHRLVAIPEMSGSVTAVGVASRRSAGAPSGPRVPRVHRWEPSRVEVRGMPPGSCRPHPGPGAGRRLLAEFGVAAAGVLEVCGAVLGRGDLGGLVEDRFHAATVASHDHGLHLRKAIPTKGGIVPSETVDRKPVCTSSPPRRRVGGRAALGLATRPLSSGTPDESRDGARVRRRWCRYGCRRFRRRRWCRCVGRRSLVRRWCRCVGRRSLVRRPCRCVGRLCRREAAGLRGAR